MNSPKEDKQRLKSMNIREHLAVDRTILAGERTLPAYLRISLTMFVAGITLINLFNNNIVVIIGLIFLPLVLFPGISGVRRYCRSGKI